MRRKTQLVARRGESVAELAEEQARTAAGGEALALSGLPAAMASAERAAIAQAATYERWAADAGQLDVLLGRSVLELALQLRAVAGQARRVRHEAREAMDVMDDGDT